MEREKMTARVVTIASIVPYGDNLTVVTTSENEVVIANRKEDGSFRWTPGEVAVFMSEGSIIPDAVLKERGYWDTEKNRGLLDGGKRNRVKARKWGPDKIVTSGLLFKTRSDVVDGVENIFVDNADKSVTVEVGQDVSNIFDITEQEA